MRLSRTLKWFIAGAAVLAGARRLARRRRRMEMVGATVVITGGSRGLGLVLARRFAAARANVVLLARDEQELERAQQELRELGAEVLALPCDVRDEDDVKRAFDHILERFGRVDVLVNSAGVIQVGPLEHMSVGDFENCMEVHMWGALRTMLAAIPHMREQGGGRIVNIASIGGKIAIPHLAPYSASKFALVGLSEAMRAELRRHGIFVTTVCPILMRTGSTFNAEFKGNHEDEFTWFSISNALPGLSMSAQRAAAKIYDALLHGDAAPSVGVQGRVLEILNALFPEVTSDTLSLANELLPGRARSGDAPQSGWESQSRWAPSLLTCLLDKAARQNNQIPSKNGATN